MTLEFESCVLLSLYWGKLFTFSGEIRNTLSPWAAYRAASTNPESPYWRQGIVSPQELLDLFGEPLLIVTTGQPKWISGPAPSLPPDHYGCGLGCNRFTGTLAGVEKHERRCAHALERLLPKGLDRDILNGDKDEQALTLLDIVVPLQHLLSVLQEARRHVLTRQAVLRRRHAYRPSAALIVASDEVPPLESAERYPAPSQKPPKSKQSTSPAAPASAPPLSSASIDPTPLFLNLLPINPPSQTGDSNLVADKTISSSHKEKVPQQKARRHALASPPLVASDEMMPLEPANRHPAPSQKVLTSKQPTPPVAPTSASPLSSASIAPNPLFLNLLPSTHPRKQEIRI